MYAYPCEMATHVSGPLVNCGQNMGKHGFENPEISGKRRDQIVTMNPRNTTTKLTPENNIQLNEAYPSHGGGTLILIM
jgi:hypothetical protein